MVTKVRGTGPTLCSSMTPNPKLTNKDRKQLASILNLMTDEELEEWLDNLKGRVARKRAERG